MNATHALIDLQRRYAIEYEQLPSGEWSAVDRRTYDDEPGARFNCEGVGPTQGDALVDLLDKIAEAVVTEPPMRCVNPGSRIDPPEYVRRPSESHDYE